MAPQRREERTAAKPIRVRIRKGVFAADFGASVFRNGRGSDCRCGYNKPC